MKEKVIFMRKKLILLLTVIMILALAVCMPSCGKKDAGDQAADAGAATEQGEGTEEPARTVVKTIEGIDEDENEIPMMIDTIVLYDDGTVEVFPTDDLKKNELKDTDAESLFPFEESGKVKDVQVLYYGNGGYRTIVALMKDGTISVVNGRALVEDHIFAVIDNVANRDNFVEIQNIEEEDGHYIVGVTEDGNEVILDYAMSFDEPEKEE